MKKILFLITLFFAGLLQIYAQTTFSNNNAVSIPDDNTTGAVSEINVTGLNPVSELVSVQINISHPYDGDLKIVLEFYDAYWVLSNQNGGSGDDYQNTVFTNTATTSITSGAAPFNGTFLPENLLPTFYDNHFSTNPGPTLNPNGVWRLHVYDLGSGDVGQINSWSITFDTPQCPDVDFAGLPSSEACNDGNDTLFANSQNGFVYPNLMFEFNIDVSSESSTNDNHVVIYENGNAFYDGYINTDRFTVYGNGPYFEPTADYTFTAQDNDGTMSWLVYDGNGTVYGSGSFTNSSTSQGPFHPAGAATWNCTPTNGLITTNYGAALFRPGTVPAGTYTITYNWDNQGTGDHHCTGSTSHTVTITNPWNASWNPPDTVCSSDAPLTLSNYVTGDGGGSFNGQGVSNGVFYPSNVSGSVSITYSVGSSSTCFSSESHSIYVVPQPTADAGQDFGTCGLAEVQLSGNATNYSHVEWTTTNGTGTINNPNSLNATYTPGPADITHTVTFTLTAYDGNACSSASDQVNVTFYETPTASVSTVDVTSCINPNGEIHVTASGGSSPYQYSIDGGLNYENSGDFTGLNAGNYTVVVSDNNSCTDTVNNVIVNNDNGPNIDSVIVHNVTCPGSNDGALTIYASGNSLVYSIDSGATYSSQNSYSGLSGGTYYIFVSDGGGCVATSTVQVIEPDQITINPTITDITCNGTCNGSISVTVSGGTSPYSYSWNNGNTSSQLSQLCAGEYILTVTDANNCTTYDTITLSAPPALNVTYDVTEGNCYEDGSTITLNVTGGDSPYTYSWSNGETTNSISVHQAGNYGVTVTDANGCSVEIDTINVTLPEPLVISQDSIIAASCYGSNDGAIYISVSGGTQPYTYLWSNNEVNEDLENIATGNYAVTVTDANGCTATNSYDVGIGGNAIHVTHTTGLNEHNLGYIDITVTGGDGTYTYQWSNGATTEDLNNIEQSGTYMVTVTDMEGCMGFDTIDVNLGLVVSTVITPNGDGRNDTWKIIGVENYKHLTLEVYNRWGNLIFKYDGPAEEYLSKEKQWNGTYNGKLVPFGSYLYIVKADDVIKKGTIVVK